MALPEWVYIRRNAGAVHRARYICATPHHFTNSATPHTSGVVCSNAALAALIKSPWPAMSVAPFSHMHSKGQLGGVAALWWEGAMP